MAIKLVQDWFIMDSSGFQKRIDSNYWWIGVIFSKEVKICGRKFIAFHTTWLILIKMAIQVTLYTWRSDFLHLEGLLIYFEGYIFDLFDGKEWL